MKRIVLIVPIAVGVLFISMCGEKDFVFDGNSTTFEGIVQDSATGTPVESVNVSPIDTILGISKLFTDSVGFFGFIDPSGRAESPLFFLKAGYETVLCTLVAGRRDTIHLGKQ